MELQTGRNPKKVQPPVPSPPLRGQPRGPPRPTQNTFRPPYSSLRRPEGSMAAHIKDRNSSADSEDDRGQSRQKSTAEPFGQRSSREVHPHTHRQDSNSPTAPGPPSPPSNANVWEPTEPPTPEIEAAMSALRQAGGNPINFPPGEFGMWLVRWLQCELYRCLAPLIPILSQPVQGVPPIALDSTTAVQILMGKDNHQDVTYDFPLELEPESAFNLLKAMILLVHDSVGMSRAQVLANKLPTDVQVWQAINATVYAAVSLLFSYPDDLRTKRDRGKPPESTVSTVIARTSPTPTSIEKRMADLEAEIEKLSQYMPRDLCKDDSTTPSGGLQKRQSAPNPSLRHSSRSGASLGTRFVAGLATMYQNLSLRDQYHLDSVRKSPDGDQFIASVLGTLASIASEQVGP